MKEMKISDKTIQYEKVMPEQFKKGACVFRVKDEDGDDSWWVVVPQTLKAQMEGVAINCLDDGHVAALCAREQDALMLASSVHIAGTVAGRLNSIVKSAVNLKDKELAEKLGLDIDKLEAEVAKLRKEGKTANEVLEIVKPRMEEFKKNGGSPDTDKGGEW